MGRRGIERIIKQKMTPLYVSVHATDVDVRTRMLGIKRRIDVLDLLRQLTAGGITVQSQVVVCPGWNDGAILEKSVRELAELYPGVETLAIVPVGLSAHRDGLTKLDPVTPEIAASTIALVHGLQKELADEHGVAFAHLSDEFYLLADEPSLRWSSTGNSPRSTTASASPGCSRTCGTTTWTWPRPTVRCQPRR